jgi:DNA-binding MurR/RpiR family transcriptional regulator
MMEKEVLHKFKENYAQMFTSEMIASFNELETSIYNYVCQNAEKVIYMRIRELAEVTHVSTATILRFCRKVNCEGFSEFKVKLKMYLEDRKKTTIKSAKNSVIEFLERTLKGNLDEQIHAAARFINEADTVIFIGVGSSGIVGEYGARYFSSFRKFSMYIKDPFYPIHSIAKNSTTIALSVSGETEMTITLLNRLKQEGSKIVSVTNNKYSTVAKMSDINIPYYVTEEFHENANITTQIPAMYILESMARELYKLNIGE